MKELIQMINNAENYDVAKGMLRMFNAIYGTQYGLLGMRVVRSDDPYGYGSVSEKYSSCHDVLIELELS